MTCGEGVASAPGGNSVSSLLRTLRSTCHSSAPPSVFELAFGSLGYALRANPSYKTLWCAVVTLVEVPQGRSPGLCGALS